MEDDGPLFEEWLDDLDNRGEDTVLELLAAHGVIGILERFEAWLWSNGKVGAPVQQLVELADRARGLLEDATMRPGHTDTAQGIWDIGRTEWRRIYNELPRPARR